MQKGEAILGKVWLGLQTTTGQWAVSTTRFRLVLKVCLVLVSVVVVVAGAIGHGDRNQNLARLDAKIEADGNSVPLLIQRAAAHRRLGHYEASLADLDRALAISPDNHQIHYLRGLAHFSGGKFAAAEVALSRYVAAKPESPAGHIALAETLTQQGRHLAAAAEYTLAIDAQPSPIPDYYLARARAYQAAGRPYLDVAVEGLDEGASTLGPVVALQQLAINIELDRENHAGAIARIDEILATASRKETWLVRKGLILASIGQVSEALEAFRLAKAAMNALPTRIRSSPAMEALRQTISAHLDPDSLP